MAFAGEAVNVTKVLSGNRVRIVQLGGNYSFQKIHDDSAPPLLHCRPIAAPLLDTAKVG